MKRKKKKWGNCQSENFLMKTWLEIKDFRTMSMSTWTLSGVKKEIRDDSQEKKWCLQRKVNWKLKTLF